MTAKPRVLYVDDERGNLVAFKYMFRDEYAISTSISGAAALELMAQQPFDVVISDQRMPEMTGVEFLERVHERYPDTIRMVLTGFSDMEAMVAAVNKGKIAHYFQKPWDEHEVRRAIARALEVQELQRSLQREQKRLRWVIEGIPDGILILDAARNVRMVNKRLCEMTGYDEQTLMDSSVERVIPTFFDKVRLDEDAVEGGRRTVGHDHSLVCRHRGGVEFPVEITISSQQLDGELRWIAAVRDVAIQRRMARALVESEEKLREAQSVAGVGHWELNHGSGRIVWSEQTYRIFACEPRDFDGTLEGLSERIHPDDRETVAEAFMRHVGERTPYNVEHRIVSPDGGLRYVNERCFTDYDDTGQPTRSLGTVQDVTERRLAELELERHRKDLQGLIEERTVELWAAHEEVSKSEARYRELLENIAAAVLVLDAHGRLAYCNKSAAAVLRRSTDDIVGRSGLGSDFHYLPQDGLLLPPGDQPLARAYETKKPVLGVETPIRFDDGTVTWILGNAFPVLDSHGEIREVVVTLIDVTESKRAEEARARDEERLEALLDLASQVTAAGEVVNMEEAVLETAASLARSPMGCFYYFGGGEESVRFTAWSSAPGTECASGEEPKDCPMRGLRLWQEVKQAGKIVIQNERQELESNGFCAANHHGVYRCMGVPVFDGSMIAGVVGVCNKAEPYNELDARQIEQFIGSAMALIRRAEAEQALRKSEENFRTLVTEITDGFYTTDEQGRLTFSNLAFARMLRFEEPEEIIGAPLWNLVRRTRRESLEAKYIESLSSGSFEKAIVGEVIRADGTTGFMEIHPAPIFDQERVVGSRGVVRDITERRQAEAEMRKLSRAVWASPVGVMVTDQTGHIEYVNPKFTETTGYTSEEVIGLNPRLLSAGTQDPSFYEEMWKTIISGRDWRGEFCNRKKNGEIIWENTSISPIRDETGEITHFVAVKEDITASRRVGEELRQAKEAADAANRAKSAFLANMSHEIRTPMNAILGYSQLLQRTGLLSEQQQEFLRTINRSGEHLLVLINDVLEMSKIEAGQTNAVKKTFDLFSLLDDVERMFQERTRAKGIELTVEKTDSLVRYLFSDEAKVRQVLINVVGNAVKFTEEGQVVLRADSEKCRDGRTLVLIDVEDTGPGLHTDDLETIFEPFAQTEVGRQHGGSGLGMAISRKFAEQMDGGLSATSELGRGSVFRFEFKAQEQSRTNLVSMPPPRRAVGVVPGQASKRVLVVDDLATNRDVLVHMLTPLGFSVEQAADGQEALAAMIKWMPDVVLMDMQMPVMDGKEATRRIRSMPDGRDIPVLMVTASAMEENREEALVAGADGFIRKPYREDEILEEINRVTGIQYVFEHTGSRGAESLPMAEPIQRQSLTWLSAELVGQLKASIEAGDMEQFSSLTEKVRSIDSRLAAGLADLAAQFEYDQLLDLLEKGVRGDD